MQLVVHSLMRVTTWLALVCVSLSVPTVGGAQRIAPAGIRASLPSSSVLRAGDWAPATRQPARERRRPWLRNALVGATVGGAVGYGLGRASCNRCDEPAPIYAAAVLGAGAGALAGVAVTLTTRGASAHGGQASPRECPDMSPQPAAREASEARRFPPGHLIVRPSW